MINVNSSWTSRTSGWVLFYTMMRDKTCNGVSLENPIARANIYSEKVSQRYVVCICFDNVG